MQTTDLTQTAPTAEEIIVALPLDMLALVGGGDGAVVPF